MKGLSNNVTKKLQRMFAPGPEELTIGLGGMAGLDTGESEPGSLRVAMTRGDVLIQLTPRQARVMASDFEKHPGYATAGIEWIPQTLREVADEIDAKVAKHN